VDGGAQEVGTSNGKRALAPKGNKQFTPLGVYRRREEGEGDDLGKETDWEGMRGLVWSRKGLKGGRSTRKDINPGR